MAYKSGADGITKQGKNKGRKLCDEGAKVVIVKDPKHACSKVGKKKIDMKTMGRGMAKVAAQKKG